MSLFKPKMDLPSRQRPSGRVSWCSYLFPAYPVCRCQKRRWLRCTTSRTTLKSTPGHGVQPDPRKSTGNCDSNPCGAADPSGEQRGGAMLGAAIAGPIGAAIGGRAKEKKIQSTTSFLVVSYTGKDGAPAYITFDALYTPKCADIVKLFQKRPRQTGKIEL